MNDLDLIKNDNIDEDAVLSYVDKTVDNDEWKSVYKVAVGVCLKEIVRDSAEIVKKFQNAPFNITSDQCNVKYMSLMTCIRLEGFSVSLLKISHQNVFFCNFEMKFLEMPKRKLD